MHLTSQIIVSVIIAVIFSIILHEIWSINPYMDEIFHIPQAQHYCLGQFQEWNPKITTFPGLYVISYLLHQFSTFFSHDECSSLKLRLLNFCSSLTIPIFAGLCRKKIYGSSNLDLIPIIIFFYPVCFFYCFLYYTDNLSLNFSLFLNWLILTNQSYESIPFQIGLFAASAFFLLVRQTNAVWLLYFVGITIVQDLRKRKRLSERGLGLEEVVTLMKCLYEDLYRLVCIIWPLLLPVALFAAFVLYNGSIVVGDKENHVAGVHPAMIAHGILLSSMLSFPVTLDHWLSSGKSLKQFLFSRWRFSEITLLGWLAYISFSVAVCLMLIYGSKSHPFLLSDNRHFTFYLWKRLLGRKLFRVAVSPIYGFATLYFVLNLQSQNGLLWVLIYFIACTLVLVPTPLLELRYFTQPISIALLNLPVQYNGKTSVSSRSIAFQLILLASFIVMNSCFLYIFLYRSFVWGDGTIARFMF